MDKWLTTLKACLSDAGWETNVDFAQNAISPISLPEDQNDAFMSASQNCEQQVGKAPNDVPMTIDSAAAIYDHLVEMRSCLLTNFHYETSQPPARSVFVDDYLAGRAPWSPYLDLPDRALSGAEWQQINIKCPQSIE